MTRLVSLTEQLRLYALPVCDEAADEIERLRAKLLQTEGTLALAGIGIDAHAIAVDLGKKTMAKLIAAEKEIERLQAALLDIASEKYGMCPAERACRALGRSGFAGGKVGRGTQSR